MDDNRMNVPLDRVSHGIYYPQNMLVTLKPTTKRLKQLITEHGSTWKVLQIAPVTCFADCKIGYLIESLNLQHSRWVRPIDVEEIS